MQALDSPLDRLCLVSNLVRAQSLVQGLLLMNVSSCLTWVFGLGTFYDLADCPFQVHWPDQSSHPILIRMIIVDNRRKEWIHLGSSPNRVGILRWLAYCIDLFYYLFSYLCLSPAFHHRTAPQTENPHPPADSFNGSSDYVDQGYDCSVCLGSWMIIAEVCCFDCFARPWNCCLWVPWSFCSELPNRPIHDPETQVVLEYLRRW